jgi:hypothetical protein
MSRATPTSGEQGRAFRVTVRVPRYSGSARLYVSQGMLAVVAMRTGRWATGLTRLGHQDHRVVVVNPRRPFPRYVLLVLHEEAQVVWLQLGRRKARKVLEALDECGYSVDTYRPLAAMSASTLTRLALASTATL